MKCNAPRVLAQVVVGIFAVVVGSQLATMHVSLQNSLADMPFVSSKLLVARSVIAAGAYMTTTVAVSGNRLNLGAWHGFQELFIDRAFTPPFVVEWTYRLPRSGSYLSFLYGPEGDRLAGLRMSRDARFPSMAFRAVGQEFVEKQPLGPDASRGRLRCVFEPESVSCERNGSEIWRGHGAGAAPLRLGFRGGHQPAYLDDVAVMGADGQLLFEERFDPQVSTGMLLRWMSGVGLAFLLVELAVGRVLARRGEAHRLYGLLTMGLCATVCLALLTVALPQFQRLYPVVGEGAREDERRWANAHVDKVIEIATRKYDRRDGRRVVVMLGTSQTWGAGAAREEDVIAERLERLLGEDRYVVLNSGISGYRSELLRDVYLTHWLHRRPAAVIINLGNNDRDAAVLDASVRTIAEVNARWDIATILVLEPNTIEVNRTGLGRMHDTLSALAAELRLPLVDLRGVLDERHDAGFLWWDAVHLTSFGQRLFAEELHRQIAPALAGLP